MLPIGDGEKGQHPSLPHKIEEDGSVGAAYQSNRQEESKEKAKPFKKLQERGECWQSCMIEVLVFTRAAECHLSHSGG